MLRHFRPKTVETVKIMKFLQNVKKVTVTSLALPAPQLKKKFKINFLHRKPVCIRELLKKNFNGLGSSISSSTPSIVIL